MPLSGVAELKAECRQVLHENLAVSAFYSDGETPEPAEPNCTVRWHNKLARNGALDGNYAGEIIEGIDRLVFQDAELNSNNLTLRQGGRVRIPDLVATFELDVREPGDGPLNVYWTVARMRDGGA
jgi:hypothetical protein